MKTVREALVSINFRSADITTDVAHEMRVINDLSLGAIERIDALDDEKISPKTDIGALRWMLARTPALDPYKEMFGAVLDELEAQSVIARSVAEVLDAEQHENCHWDESGASDGECDCWVKHVVAALREGTPLPESLHRDKT